MRALLVLFALVATPFLASVAQERPSSAHREYKDDDGDRRAHGRVDDRRRGNDDDDDDDERRAGKRGRHADKAAKHVKHAHKAGKCGKWAQKAHKHGKRADRDDDDDDDRRGKDGKRAGRDDQHRQCAPEEPAPADDPLPPPSDPLPPPPPTGTSAIDGTVFNDVEPWSGLSGWTIELRGQVTRTAVTDASGHYAFTGLPEGTYTVCEVVPSGWRQTVPDTGTPCPTGLGYAEFLPEGNSLGFRNFGNVTP